MLKLERLRFINIGAPDCRMRDLAISTVDDRGEPVDTVLWLRNGGGKTVILGLFFAHLLPDAREFLKGRKENAKFGDHVLEGDTSFILASWVGEAAALDLLGDGRPRLVTGRVVERKPGYTGASLPGLLFTFRPVPGVIDIDTVPWQIGGRRLSLAAFDAEMRRLGRDHPELEYTVTDKQSQWAARLQDVGLDPQVFRYQRQMNAGEAEAATGFMQFRTSDEFVDFLLGVVTPAAKLESLENEIRRYSEKLRRLPEWRDELQLIERAVPLLRTHAGHLREREGLERERAELMARAARLGAQLAAGAEEAAGQARAAQADLERLEADGQRIREKRQDLQSRLRELDYRVACLLEEAALRSRHEAEQALQAAKRAVAGWRLTESLARRQELGFRRRELANLLEARRQDAAPLLAQLEQTGSALRWRRLSLAAEIDAAAGSADRRARDLQAEADACQAEAERLRTLALELRHRVSAAQAALAELGRLRASLRADGALREGEGAEAATARWQAAQREAQAHLADVEARIRAMADEAAELQRRERDCSVRIAARAREIADLQRRRDEMERRQRALREREAIRAVVEVDEPDLWREGSAIDQALGRRLLEIANEQVAAGIRSAEDRRACAGIEAHGTLPPSLDTEQALAVLRDAGIRTAYPGWDFLRRAADAEAAARLLLRAPELAGGILLNDAAELAAARAALDAAGFRPLSVMAVGLAEGFERSEGGEHAFLVPPHAGLYDPAAAADELARASERLRQADAHRAALQAAAQAVLEVRQELRSFLEAYPAGEPERVLRTLQAREAEVAELERSLQAAEARRTEIDGEQGRLQEERRATDRLIARIPGILGRLADLAGRERSEPEWQALVTEGPPQAAAHEEGSRLALARQREHHAERDRLLRWAERQRAEAEQVRQAAGGLPEVDFPDELRGLSVGELDSRHQALRSAYEQRLGADAVKAEMDRIAAELARIEPLVEGAPPEVREAAAAFLASADGQTDALRRAALRAAEDERERATRTEALAARAAEDRRQQRLEAERLREQAPRPDVAVPSLEAALELRRRTGEQEREAESEENRINAQYGRVTPRLEAAKHRESRLRAALSLAATVLDDETVGPGDQAEPFPGTEDDADGEARAVVAGFKRVERELAAARTRASDSAGELRRLGEQEPYRRLPAPLTLRLAEPGGSADAVGELADELERRLPGLRADIDSAESDRKMVLIGLVQAAKDGFRDLRRLEEASRLPEGLDAWSGVPFVQIGADPPRGDDEWEARLTTVLQDWVDRQEIPANSGLQILRQAVRAANGRTAAAPDAGGGTARSSFHVTLLKPDAVLTRQRHSVEAMKFSEGQDLTTAILLYCTFINLRVRRSGDAAGAAGALLLDNPIGKASLDRLIELQRRVAALMKVQIIATTGVRDREAISHYPKIVGLRPVRSRDARMKYLQPSDDPMGLGGIEAAELVVKAAP
jgi:hypothetical protein